MSDCTQACRDRSAAAVRDYLDSLLDRGLSHETIRDRRKVLRRLADYLTDTCLIDADDVQLDVWRHALNHLSAGYIVQQVSTAHSFYAWAVRRGLRERNPARELARPRRPRRLPRPISEAKLNTAIERAPTATIRLWLMLAAFAGLRAMEIAGLECTNLHMDSDPPLMMISGKGRKERLVPIAPVLATALRDYGIDRLGRVFVWPTGRGYEPREVSTIASGYLHGLGIPDTLHALRHRFGTIIYDTSKDLRLTQELLGHSRPETTAGYVAWSRGDAAAAVTAASSVRNATAAGGRA